MTLAEIAREEGCDEETIRRVLLRACAKLLAGAKEIDVDPDFFSTVIVAFLEGPRGISPIACDGENMHRVPPFPSSPVAPGEVLHAVHLPRRFK